MFETGRNELERGIVFFEVLGYDPDHIMGFWSDDDDNSLTDSANSDQAQGIGEG